MDSTLPSTTDPIKEPTPVLESLLRRDRLIILAALGGIVALAWGYMLHEARVMTVTGVCECLGMKMSGPDVRRWAPADLVPLFGMWTEMMVAMMVPSAAAMILTFAAVQRRRRAMARPYVRTGAFLGGYLAAWTAFSGLAAVAQWTLHGAALLSPGMVSASPILGGVLLLAAGVFQWTPLKSACLAHCRSPLSFLMTGWREGTGGAFNMGLRHGTYCTGCCWFLMALLFVAGVMNMWWVAAISVLVLLEKLLPRGVWFGRLAGVVLCAWGLWMASSALRKHG